MPYGQRAANTAGTDDGLEDLDAIAESYARRRDGAGSVPARRLRDEMIHAGLDRKSVV